MNRLHLGARRLIVIAVAGVVVLVLITVWAVGAFSGSSSQKGEEADRRPSDTRATSTSSTTVTSRVPEQQAEPTEPPPSTAQPAASSTTTTTQPTPNETRPVTTTPPPTLPGPPRTTTPSGPTTTTRPGTTGPKVLTSEDDGATVSIKLGDTLIVRLPKLPGFSWLVGENDPNMVDGGDTTNTPGLVGFVDITFQAVGTGTSTLSLAAMSDLDPNIINAAVSFTIKVVQAA